MSAQDFSYEALFGSRDEVNWITTIALVIFHILAIVALFNPAPGPILFAFIMHWIAVGWGIGLGYHRLHTHRSYWVPKPIEYFLAICGTLTLEGGPLFWVATHRIHHQKSDKPGDPHSPRDGAWWAHMLWTTFGKSLHSNTAALEKYAPDLAKDRFYRVLNEWHWVPLTVFGLTVWAVAGLPYLLWGVFFRVVFGLHATWLVNSATHMWGSRRFETRDDSTNSFWVAILTFGEGWHNNHHAHPTSARHGLVWWEIDLSWMQIWLLSVLGIARDIKLPAAAQIERMSTPLDDRKAA